MKLKRNIADINHREYEATWHVIMLDLAAISTYLYCKIVGAFIHSLNMMRQWIFGWNKQL